MKLLQHKFWIVGFLIVSFFMMIKFTTPVYADTINIDRLEGTNRYQTAVAISRSGWETSDYAVLTRGDQFADALCAGPLAAKYHAPILMTPSQKLDSTTLGELKRLGVRHLLIAGGTGAISTQVEITLRAAGITEIQRFAGKDRYETSVKIAMELSGQSVALATGENFPDALSISVTAAKLGIPILLTRHDALPESVKDYLKTTSVTRTYLIGGEGVISSNIENVVPYPYRLFGVDRYGTNIAVIKYFENEFNFGHIYVAKGGGPNGNEFADALAGAVLAAKTASPLILVGKTLPQASGTYLLSKITPATQVTGLGGVAAIPTSVLQSIPDLLNTALGNLAITPLRSTAGETTSITLTYSVGEDFVNGSLEFTLPDKLPAVQGQYLVSIGSIGFTYTDIQITDSGYHVTVSGVTAKAGEKIILSLLNTVPEIGNYRFKVIADADGQASFRLPSTGSDKAAKLLVINSPQLGTVHEQFISKNRPYQSLAPQGFVIHSTATPGGSAQFIYNLFNSSDRQASVHYAADWTEIVQLIPENEVAWHAGVTANHRYLSLEMCEPKGLNQVQFQQVWNRTVLLVADACVRYGWNTNDNIFSHNDITYMFHETDHSDPIGFLAKYNRTWAQLLQAIDAKIIEIRSE